MRSFLLLTSLLLSLMAAMTSAVPLPIPTNRKDILVLSHDQNAASTQFLFPAAAPHQAETRNLDLIFNLQVQPSSDHFSTRLLLNSLPLDIAWNDANPVSQFTHLVRTTDVLDNSHHVNVSVSGQVDHPATTRAGHEVQKFTFALLSLDKVDLPSSHPGFSILASPMSSPRLLQLRSEPNGSPIDFATPSIVVSGPPIDFSAYDLVDEAESLLQLEAQAEELRAQIAFKKQTISAYLKNHRDAISLQHLLAECDSLMCSAKVIAQRICDKIGVATDPTFAYPRKQSQEVLSVNEKTNSTQSESQASVPQQQEANLRLMLTKNGTAQEYHVLDLVDPTNPFIRVLQIICGAIGLTALFSFIRSRCMSMRTKVDRAAAREERRNARAYRRAARRAEMRKRWNEFVDAINCFGRREEPRHEDYEEKRALILQDAFLEQMEDLEQAEKGEVMEAEIRELRHAHDLVSSLIQDERRQGLRHNVHDPPPPLVPIPRSRASTQTLPPYTSDVESLPSYTSRPVTLAGSNSSVISSSSPASVTSDDDDRRPPPSESNTTRSERTLLSSVIETSPRLSQETMRTRQSKSTRGRPSMDV